MQLKRIVCSLLFVLLSVTVLFSSCNRNTVENESTTGYEYFHAGSESTTAEQSGNSSSEEINIDTSWQKNFYVKYRYYNPEQSITTMNIEEKRADTVFTVEYLDTGSLLYYKENGNNTDYYVIIDNEDEQVHSVLEGKKFSNLSSMFMKLSQVSEDLPEQNNVLYMYDEAVAGRNCKKYIQRAYTDGKLTETVYVWIDAQYGFAAKCEAYDAGNKITLMWSVESFETGNMKDEDVAVDINLYNFKENLG